MELQRWTIGTPDELRCDFILQNGQQCGNMAESGIHRCALHGANKILAAQERKSLRLYNIAVFQSRHNELTDHDKLKSLREEIALLRLMIEARINQCTDTHDLLLQSGPLSDLVMKVEKAVKSCNQLEGSLGDMLDKQKVKNLAAAFMNIIANKIGEYIGALEDKGIVLEDKGASLIESIATEFLLLLESKDA